MFEDIKKNKIKSWFIVLLFLAFIAVIVYYICMALDLGELSIIIAMILQLYQHGAHIIIVIKLF